MNPSVPSTAQLGIAVPRVSLGVIWIAHAMHMRLASPLTRCTPLKVHCLHRVSRRPRVQEALRAKGGVK
jgi:hypothetical protein